MRCKKYSLKKFLSSEIKKTKRAYKLSRELYGVPLHTRDITSCIDLAEPKFRKVYENLKLYQKLESLRAGDIGPFVIRKRKSKMVFDEFNTYDPVRGIEYTGIMITWYRKHNRIITVYIITD